MLMVPGEYHIAGTFKDMTHFSHIGSHFPTNNCCTTKWAFLETLFANNLLGLG